MTDKTVRVPAVGAGLTVKLLPTGQWNAEVFGPNGSMRQQFSPMATSELEQILPELLERAAASSQCNCMQCLCMRVMRSEVDEKSLRLAAFNQKGCAATGCRA